MERGTQSNRTIVLQYCSDSRVSFLMVPVANIYLPTYSRTLPYLSMEPLKFLYSHQYGIEVYWKNAATVVDADC